MDDDKQQKWQETIDSMSDQIHWRFALLGGKRHIYRPENGYFTEITEKECRIEVRDILKYARSGTITEIVLNLLESSDRLLDPRLFAETRKRGIGFENGFFDLRTGQLRTYQPHDYVLDPLPHVLPKEMDSGAERWFIDEILTSWVGKETADWFCNLLAYQLFIFPNVEQKWVNFFGMGANGKSVCLKILEQALGDPKVIGCDLAHINRFSKETFDGKWLIIGRDSGSLVSDNATSLIKNYSGDDKVVVEVKGGSSYDNQVSGKLIISTNNLIQSRDRSHGWYRRLLPIPFPNEFEENPDFEQSVLKRLPQIIRVLCHRAYLYRKNKTKLGACLPATCRDLVQETRFVNDRVAGFWEIYFHEYVDVIQKDEQGRDVVTGTERRLVSDRVRSLHALKMSEVYDRFCTWHKDEYGEMDIEPSLKQFGGPYGAFLQSPAGKFFEYRKTKMGRMVELRPSLRDTFLKMPELEQDDFFDEEKNPF